MKNFHILTGGGGLIREIFIWGTTESRTPFWGVTWTKNNFCCSLSKLKVDVVAIFSLRQVNHFGIASGGDRIKFLDLDSVLPRRFAGHITGDGRQCERHTDCDYFDCRSQCSDSTGTCDSPVTNNNLQVSMLDSAMLYGEKVLASRLTNGYSMCQYFCLSFSKNFCDV